MQNGIFLRIYLGKLAGAHQKRCCSSQLNRNIYLFSCMVVKFVQQTQQFTINKRAYEIFGAVSEDLYSKISAFFGADSVENLVDNRRNHFINSCGETDNCLCQMLC